MITDEDIIDIITTRNRGGKIMYSNTYDVMEYVVTEDHVWNFIINTYEIINRFPEHPGPRKVK